MNIVLISKDEHLIRILESNPLFKDNKLLIYSDCCNTLNAVSYTIKNSPSVLIFDDELYAPGSAEMLKSIKTILKDLLVIFVTSDDSIELGREISQLGIHYYCIRPINETSISDSLESILKLLDDKPY